MNCIIPDIAYVVSNFSRYTNNPSDGHWTALLRVVAAYLIPRDMP